MRNIEEYRRLLKKIAASNTFESYAEVITNRIIDYISKRPDAIDQQIVSEITRVFGTEYSSYVREAIAKYEELNKQVNTIYKDMGIEVPRSFDKLQSIEGVSRIRYGQYSHSALDALKKTVRKGLAEELSLKDLKERLNNLGGRVSFYADTIAETQYSAYGQTQKNIKADLAGVERFEYVGPVHVHTRAFCMKHLGKIYTKAEILALDADPDLGGAGIRPVMVYKGGWNCYHDWEPVVD